MVASVTASLMTDPDSSPEDRHIQLQAANEALLQLDPRNALEAMLAARVVSTHHTAMDTFRRAARPGLADAACLKLQNTALKLANLSAAAQGALEKLRKSRTDQTRFWGSDLTSDDKRPEAPATDNTRARSTSEAASAGQTAAPPAAAHRPPVGAQATAPRTAPAPTGRQDPLPSENQPHARTPATTPVTIPDSQPDTLSPQQIRVLATIMKNPPPKTRSELMASTGHIDRLLGAA
jgi:hypothetical protein